LALLENGYYSEAIEQLTLALKESTVQTMVPVILMKLAEAYNGQGEFEKASIELKKVELLIELINNTRTA